MFTLYVNINHTMCDSIGNNIVTNDKNCKSGLTNRLTSLEPVYLHELLSVEEALLYAQTGGAEKYPAAEKVSAAETNGLIKDQRGL